MKTFTVFLLLVCTLCACKQDEVLSFGQQTAAKIQNESKIATIARVYIGDRLEIESGAFRFDGDFIIVDAGRYNLNRLIGYRVINISNTQTLLLYF